MKARTVRVCAKAMTESSPGYSNASFRVNSHEFSKRLPRERDILIVQDEFGKIISIERIEYCFVNA
jgi:hypothetical protein